MKDRLFVVPIICLIFMIAGCMTTTIASESERTVVTMTGTTSPTATVTPPSPLIVSITLAPIVPAPTVTASPTAVLSVESQQLPYGPPVVFVYNEGVLVRTDADGSGVEPLAAPLGRAGDAVWMTFHTNPPQVSPDGRYLIIFTGVSSSRGNWQVVDLQTKDVIAAGQGQSQLSPTWSPDSRRFAYLAHEQICIFDLTNQSDTCSIVGPNLAGAAWSPTGSQIAIAQANFDNNQFTGQVWLFQVDTKTAENVGTFETPPQATVDEAVEWTADGAFLLIKSTTENVTSALYSVTDGTSVTFSRPARTLSPDGQVILFRTGEAGYVDSDVIYSLPANETCPRVTLGLHNWDWSPDNLHLAYLLSCANAPEKSWLTVFNIVTGNLVWQQEVTGLDNTFSLEFLYWSPDGAYLLLDEPDELYEGQRQLSPVWRVPSDGSVPPEVVVEHGFLLGIVPQWVP